MVEIFKGKKGIATHTVNPWILFELFNLFTNEEMRNYVNASALQVCKKERRSHRPL